MQYSKAFDVSPTMSNEELFMAVIQMNNPKRRLNTLIITMIIVVSIVTLGGTAYAAVLLGLIEVTPIVQTPVDGYTNIDDNSELLSVRHEFDGGSGSLELYVSTYNLIESSGKYTLERVALRNARMILLKPKDSSGFFIRKGGVIHLYTQLDLTAEYVGESGKMVQIGYSLDGVLYETYRGKLMGGGETFEITAPCDGEFVVFVINASLDLQNYTELSVMLKDK